MITRPWQAPAADAPWHAPGNNGRRCQPVLVWGARRGRAGFGSGLACGRGRGGPGRAGGPDGEGSGIGEGNEVSGDGWVTCDCGARHWGRHGAAGLLQHAVGQVLLQHRAEWSHEGGTWGVPGGARHRDESAWQAALRESAEEAGTEPAVVCPRGELVVDHGTWSYTTVVACTDPAGAGAPRPRDAESIELRWVPVGEVTTLPLHSGFAATWPLLRSALGLRLVLVVDAANVVGSRPDGWWRDRAGATARLRAELGALLARPLPDADLPETLPRPALTRWHLEAVLVVEGSARALPAGQGHTATTGEGGGVAVVAAQRSGDDAVVAEVRRRAAAGATVLAVTADRELTRRATASGATVVGPRWMLDRLEAASAPGQRARG